jgi:hypothetical protein
MLCIRPNWVAIPIPLATQPRSLKSEVTDCYNPKRVPSLGFFFVTIRAVLSSNIVSTGWYRT